MMSLDDEKNLLERFAHILEKHLRWTIDINEREVVFRIARYGAGKQPSFFSMSRSDLVQHLEVAVNDEMWKDGFFSAEDNLLEHPVRFVGGPTHHLLVGSKRFKCKARGCAPKLCLTTASTDCALSMLMRAQTVPRYAGAMVRMLMEGRSADFDQLMQCIGPDVLQIKNSPDLDMTGLKSLAKDYLLNVAMAYGVSYELGVDGNDQHRTIRFGVDKEASLFPYRSYDEQVARYYHQAIVANELPFAQYLAFYQVIEYYYDKSLKDSVMAILEDATTNVYPTKEKLEGCYRRIANEFEGENASGRERVDLSRCIQRQVDLIALVDRLKEFDRDAVKYYSRNNVRFVKQEKRPEAEKVLKVNLLDGQQDPHAVLETIADRIYSVRCAIVHSKSDVASNYQPFLHDDDLAKEVPLVRAVAEQMLRGAASIREL